MSAFAVIISLVASVQLLQEGSDVIALVKQLGSADIDARDQAATELVKIGLPAISPLEMALNTRDQEHLLRIRSVVQGIYDQEATRTLARVRAGIRSASCLVFRTKVVGKYIKPEGKDSPETDFKVFIKAPEHLLIQQLNARDGVQACVRTTPDETTLYGVRTDHLPKDLPEQVAEAFGTFSVMGTLVSLTPNPFRDRQIDYRKDLAPTKITMTAEGLRAKKLSYELESTHPYFAQPIRIDLWYTGNPPRPKKRVIAFTFNEGADRGKVLQATETFLEWSTEGKWPE